MGGWRRLALIEVCLLAFNKVNVVLKGFDFVPDLLFSCGEESLTFGDSGSALLSKDRVMFEFFGAEAAEAKLMESVEQVDLGRRKEAIAILRALDAADKTFITVIADFGSFKVEPISGLLDSVEFVRSICVGWFCWLYPAVCHSMAPREIDMLLVIIRLLWPARRGRRLKCF